MAEGRSPEGDALSRARSAERKYAWATSAELYKEALESGSGDGGSSAEIQESMANCLVRAAFQAGGQEEFRRRLGDAIRAYDEAAKVEGRTAEQGGVPAEAASLYFRARATLARSWSETDVQSRKNAVSESVRLAEESLELCERAGAQEWIARCCGHLISCLEELAVNETSGDSMRAIITKALSYGDRAIGELSPTGREAELARSYYMTAWFCGLGRVLFESGEFRDKLSRMKDEYWKKFEALSGKLGDPVLKADALIHSGEDREPELVAKLARDAIPGALESKDNLLIAGLYAQVAYGISWAPLKEESPEAFSRTEAELYENFRESTRRYGLVGPLGIHWEWLAYGHLSVAHFLFLLARSETDPGRRAGLLDRSLEKFRSGLKDFGGRTTRISRYLEFEMGMALRDEARLTKENRLALLEEAMTHANNFVAMTNELEPHRHWDSGISLASLAYIKFERARIEIRRESQINFLKSAIETSSKGIELLVLGSEKEEGFKGSAIILGAIAYFLEEQSDMLGSLYKLNSDRLVLARRLDVLRRAEQIYVRANLFSRIAEARWELGSVHSLLNDNLSASRSYEAAAEQFLRASGKMPSLREFYMDHSAYMQAWAEIAKAKAHHQQGDYSSAKQEYDDACSLLEKTRRWGHLVSHYRACASLEHGEKLSTTDTVSDIEGAIDRFRESNSQFAGAQRELGEMLGKTDDPEEKDILGVLTSASRQREEYCQGRVHLEQARLHYRKGERLLSVREYSTAAEVLGRVAATPQTEEERKDIEAMVLSCRGWEKIQEAEFKVSTELCRDAAKLFVQASEAATKERAALVAKGNASYCRAVASTLEFKDGERTDAYVAARTHLSHAAEAYSKANLESAAGWFRAAEKAVDAQVYIESALKETDPVKRAKDFVAAEKILAVAASMYEKAGHEAKRTEALSIMKKVREESEFALSLANLLASQGAAPSTASLLVPISPQEEPAGLSQFRGAKVQIAVSLPEEIRADENFQVRLDLINTGKEPAVLHKLENLVPAGLLIAGQEQHHITGTGQLEFRGKRLPPLGIESVIFSVKSSAADLTFSPRLYYSDETGNLLTSSLYPVRIVTLPPAEFTFRSDKTRLAFDYLVDSFAGDYMSKKLQVEKSGWRSLVEISRETRISSSTIYDKKGGMGPILGELVQRGLAEARLFTGERGRGGEVTRLRVAYEKDPVKEYVNRKIRIRA